MKKNLLLAPLVAIAASLTVTANASAAAPSKKPGYLAYSRKFNVAPSSCVVATRSFVPAPRFRTRGRYTVTLTAVDKSGKQSARVSHSLVKR